MADLQAGDTFLDGQSVTGARLNNLVNNATVLPDFIGLKPSPSGNLVAADKFIYLQNATSGLTQILASTLAQGLKSVNDGQNGAVIGADADTTILAATYLILVKSALTAPRTYTLPDNGTFGAGKIFTLVDAVGGVTTSNYITIARAGADTIQPGGLTSYRFDRQRGSISLISDGGGNWYILRPAPTPIEDINSSNSTLGLSTSDIYIVGSNVQIPAGYWTKGGIYSCRFDMTKTAFGVAAAVITVRMGVAGNISDASVYSFTFSAQTAAADNGEYVVSLNFRAVGSGTAAIVAGGARLDHKLASTGLSSNGTAGFELVLPGASSGFDSTTQTNLGLSFNGGAAFSGTNTYVQARYEQI